MSVIGTNIKNIRQKKNLSLKELAKKCGTSEQVLFEIEGGKKIPNTQLTNAISKALGVQIDAIEPSYLSDYFEPEAETKKEAPQRSYGTPAPAKQKAAEKDNYEDSTLGNAFTKATRKIPVLSKITAGKTVPFDGDIVDNKLEPIFQGKNNNIKGEDFIYFIVPDNSMSGARIMKNDLALVFMTDSICDRDIILFTYNNRAYIRRCKSAPERKVLLYPENAEYEAMIVDQREIQIIGKLVRIEFKI